MPQRPVGVTDAANAAGVADIDVMERASPDIFTTTTADPGAAGTTLAITSATRFPASGQYKIRVEDEIMYVTGGQGTASWTVARGQDGTTAVAHTAGATVYYVTGVQRVQPVDGSRIILFQGRINSFRTPGRAGTTGQTILSVYNAHASKKVRITAVAVDIIQTVVKAVTVIPPIIRLWKVTAASTSGTALTKIPSDSLLNSADAAVTVLGDASADGTGSTTALASTRPAGTFYAEEFAPRLITAAGYEMFDRTVFMEGENEFITLNTNEGIVVFLDYATSVSNPTTDMWVVGLEFEEYRNN